MTVEAFSQRIGLDHTAFQEFQTVLLRVADKAFVFGCGPTDESKTVSFMIVRLSPNNGQIVLQLIFRALERIEGITNQRDWRVEELKNVFKFCLENEILKSEPEFFKGKERA